jgi:hypothetical protein
VATGRAILRGIKLAIYGFAGLLVCLVIYNAMSLAPEVHTPSVSVEVPPPPPLTGP